MPEIIAVTDLGLGNKGQISAADIAPTLRSQIIEDVAKPAYVRKASKRFRCVDGRMSAAGPPASNDAADPQEAGGPAVSEVAADLMMGDTSRLSELVAKNTELNIAAGYEVVVHGDDTHGKEGCGANKYLRAVLRSNGENSSVLVPLVWKISQALGLDKWLTQSDVEELISTGKRAAEDEKIWDITPTDLVDVARQHGAAYEELTEEHLERVVVVDVTARAFDEGQFMKDHIRPDGRPIEAFVASLGAVKAKLFDIAQRAGQSEVLAARKTMSAVVFNIGVPKELTAEATPQNPNAALPVVVLG